MQENDILKFKEGLIGFKKTVAKNQVTPCHLIVPNLYKRIFMESDTVSPESEQSLSNHQDEVTVDFDICLSCQGCGLILLDFSATFTDTTT